MSKKCEICGKSVKIGRQISHSHRVSSRKFKPNLQKVRALMDGKVKRVWVCTKCLKAGKVLKAVR